MRSWIVLALGVIAVSFVAQGCGGPKEIPADPKTGMPPGFVRPEDNMPGSMKAKNAAQAQRLGQAAGKKVGSTTAEAPKQ